MVVLPFLCPTTTIGAISCTMRALLAFGASFACWAIAELLWPATAGCAM